MHTQESTGAGLGRACYIVFGLALSMMAGLAIATEHPGVISVSAQGKAKGSPDEAGISLQFSATHLEADKAREKVDQQVRKLNKALSEFSLKEKSLDTSQTQIFPQYNYRKEAREFLGYQVNRNVSFTLSDLSQLDALLGTLTKLDIAQLNAINFGLAKPNQLKHKALARAMAQAKNTANKIASGFEVNLSKIQKVVFHPDQNPSPMQPMRMQIEAVRDQAESSYQQKDLEFTANIQVDFTFE